MVTGQELSEIARLARIYECSDTRHDSLAGVVSALEAVLLDESLQLLRSARAVRVGDWTRCRTLTAFDPVQNRREDLMGREREREREVE